MKQEKKISPFKLVEKLFWATTIVIVLFAAYEQFTQK